ncbi:MAG TPA: threonine synthase [bacterium]|nr:threonine synthase [bacterium]HPR89283.1 threonine synthase [bacterium]
MNFISRLQPQTPVSLRTALFSGLAPDGGLYLPAAHPDLAGLFAAFDDASGFGEIAAATTAALLAPEIDDAAAQRIAARAFAFAPSLRRLDDHRLLLELFHGPTCAFKDFGAQFLAAAMEELLGGERCQILVATSGDTGSAVAHAFHGRRGIDVVILYPSGRVSPLQEQQLTTLGGNVHAVEVGGSFDDCQRLVKTAFQDQRLRRALRLTSANSINIGRLLPQSFYYVYAASQRALLRPALPRFCVPSGNLGNITAGLYAWKWGLPVRGFLAATNINDIVPAYLSSGLYSPRPSQPTLSNAMDVGNPGNFERLEALFPGGWQEMRRMVSGAAVSDARTLQTIREIHVQHGLLVDPHTAVGCAAAADFLTRAGRAAAAEQVVILATAHPGKFAATVEQATGVVPEIPDRLARCLALPKRATPLQPQLPELARFLLDRFA